MVYGFDDVTLASIGVGVAETQLNGGLGLRVPAPARGIVEIIPYQMELGAFTVDQSLMTAFRMQSDDVSVEPIRFVLPGISTGDAAFVAVQAPALRAYPLNILLKGFERINYFAQAQVANAVAPGVGATVVYTEGGVGIKQFYQKPDNETTGGTDYNLNFIFLYEKFVPPSLKVRDSFSMKFAIRIIKIKVPIAFFGVVITPFSTI